MQQYEAPFFKVYELDADDIVKTSDTSDPVNPGGGATENWGSDGGYLD